VLAAGAKTVRVDMGWATLEAGGDGQRAGWYVTKIDAFMAEAAQRDLRVILTLTDTPCWASTGAPDGQAGLRGSWWSAACSTTRRAIQRTSPTRPRS
jgi:hypothetical protein